MPAVNIKGIEYPIIDISATGMKFWKANGFQEKQTIEGKISLHVGDPTDFNGNIIRIKNNMAAVNFHNELEWGILIRERNYLKNELKYRI